MLMRSFVFILSLLLSNMLLAMGHFSNVIVFGDSLSDMGNIPIASQPYNDSNKSATLENLQDNFYVPISNPVNTSAEGYMVPITHLFHLDRAPYQIVPFLEQEEKFLPQQPAINGVSRFYRSMIWNEFFIADAVQDGLTNSQYIIPWTYLASQHYMATNHESINYAWSSALSTQYCYSRHWKKKSGFCNEHSVISAWSSYFKSKDKDLESLYVPGLLAQVNIFIHDVHSKKVQVNQNTVYTVWIGGNDLSKNFGILKKDGKFELKLLALKNIAFQVAFNNYKAISLLVDDPQIQAKHIYIFGLFNPGLTPRVYHWDKIAQKAGAILVHFYNEELKFIIFLAREKYPNLSIYYVPTDSWLQEMIEGKGVYPSLRFKENLGNACALSTNKYFQQETPVENCKGYLFWNGLHPAMPVEQLLGYLFEQYLSKTFINGG